MKNFQNNRGYVPISKGIIYLKNMFLNRPSITFDISLSLFYTLLKSYKTKLYSTSKWNTISLKNLFTSINLPFKEFMFSVFYLFSSNFLFGQNVERDWHKAVPYQNEIVIRGVEQDTKNNLKSFPLMNYVIKEELLSSLKIGDTIPSSVWDMPIRYVQKELGVDTLYLSDFKDKKLIVLDFWAQWCSPCIKSMDKWEQISTKFSDDLAFFGVLIDFDYKAIPIINSRNWDSRNLIGLNAHVLNRYFFDRLVVSKLVWIKDNKVFNITGLNPIVDDDVVAAMERGEKTISPNYQFTYGEGADYR